VAKRFRSM